MWQKWETNRGPGWPPMKHTKAESQNIRKQSGQDSPEQRDRKRILKWKLSWMRQESPPSVFWPLFFLFHPLYYTHTSPSRSPSLSPPLPVGFPIPALFTTGSNGALPLRIPQRGPSQQTLCLALMDQPRKLQASGTHTGVWAGVRGWHELPPTSTFWAAVSLVLTRMLFMDGARQKPSAHGSRESPLMPGQLGAGESRQSFGAGPFYFLSHQTSGPGTRPWGRKSRALVFSCDMQSGGKSFLHGARFLFCIHVATFASE